MTGKNQAKLSANFSKGACGISEKKGPEATVSRSPLICLVIQKNSVHDWKKR